MDRRKQKQIIVLFVLAIALALAFAIFVALPTSGGRPPGIDSVADMVEEAGNAAPESAGATVGKIESFARSAWIIAFQTSSAELSRTVTLTDDEMKAFRVKAECGGGKMALLIGQGETQTSVDLSDGFDGDVDLSAFGGGVLTLTIQSRNAKDATVEIRWGE